MKPQDDSSANSALRKDSHPRELRNYRYVYAVLSRRSEGLSVGVNLNLDQRCSYNCVYCQVERGARTTASTELNKDVLAEELNDLLRGLMDGSAFKTPPFDSLPTDQRTIKDIAFSGDGEPTSIHQFADCVRIVGGAIQWFGLKDTRLVLITNASYFHKPWMVDGLAALQEYSAEIWAKLDAGTSDYYKKINRSRVSFDCILSNILLASKSAPVAIQTMLLKLNGDSPSDDEISEYIRRVNRLIADGADIRRILLYTVARKPAVSTATALTTEELGVYATRIASETGLPVKAY